MCADVHDTDLISRCGLLLHVFVWCWRRKEFKLHETTERISQRIQQQYSRDPSLLIKDSLCLDFEACLSWLIYIGGTILLDEARLKMIDVRVGHRRRWAFLKIKKKLNLQPFLNWPIILPILHFLHHYRPPVFTADCAVLAQTRRGVKDKMQQGERDGEKEKFWQRGGGSRSRRQQLGQTWRNYGKDKRHKTGLHSAEEIEQLIISCKRKHNEMPPHHHPQSAAPSSLQSPHTATPKVHVEARTLPPRLS